MESNKEKEIEDILCERSTSYGPFTCNAYVAQVMKDATRMIRPHASDVARESVDMICSKLSRLVCGDPHHLDTWRDIIGYATLVVRELEKVDERP